MISLSSDLERMMKLHFPKSLEDLHLVEAIRGLSSIGGIGWNGPQGKRKCWCPLDWIDTGCSALVFVMETSRVHADSRELSSSVVVGDGDCDCGRSLSWMSKSGGQGKESRVLKAALPVDCLLLTSFAASETFSEESFTFGGISHDSL
jgi:hypothetical protein